MTERAIARVPVDWQVEAPTGANPRGVLAQGAAPAGRRARAAGRLRPHHRLQRQRRRLHADHRARAGCSALPPGYARAFPGELRMLAGQRDRRAARPADRGQPARAARRHRHDRTGRRAGRAACGSPASSTSRRPTRCSSRSARRSARSRRRRRTTSSCCPRRTFDRAMRGAPVTTQVHAASRHALPGSPSSAFTQVSGAARNLETRLAGAGLVGDNLGSALDQAREDALYAQLLFLFLGVPGAVLAGLRHRVDRLRRRATGAAATSRCCARAARRPRRLVRLALAETALAGGVGVAAGLAGALAIGSAAFGTASFGAGPRRGRAVGGRRGARRPRDRRRRDRAARLARRARAHRRRPAPRRSAAATARRGGRATASTSLALAGAALVYWQASRNGYQLVLAPEGVPQVSVNWYALLAPVLGLGRRRPARLPARRPACSRAAARPLARALRPLAGELSPTVAATMSRQRRLLARAVALVALDRRVRRLHRRLQLDLPAAGRGRRAADQRRRRDGHRVARRERRARRGRAARARAGRAAASSRCSTASPTSAPTCRTSTACGPRTIGAAGKLQDGWFAGRQRERR